MARKMCDMTPTEQKRARELARIRQQRRRDWLREAGIKGNQAKRTRHRSRCNGPTIDEDEGQSGPSTRKRRRDYEEDSDDDSEPSDDEMEQSVESEDESEPASEEEAAPSDRGKGKARERQRSVSPGRHGMRLRTRTSDDDDEPIRKRSRLEDGDGEQVAEEQQQVDQVPSVEFVDDLFGPPSLLLAPARWPTPPVIHDDDINTIYADNDDDDYIYRPLPPLDASSSEEEEEVLQQLDEDEDDELDEETIDHPDMIPPVATLFDDDDHALPLCSPLPLPAQKSTPLFFPSPFPLKIRIKIPKKVAPNVTRSPPRLQRPIALTPNDRDENDLVTGILGIQVDARAGTVQWTSGQRTVLPYLPKRTKKGIQNLLSNEERFTQELATLPEAGPRSNLVLYLDKNLQKDKLWKEAREALGNNKAVVVHGYVDTEGFQFNKEDLEENFDISPHRPVQVHDMAKRVVKTNLPHVDTRVGDFLDAITNTTVSQVALGFPLPQFNAPEPFGKLDDGLALGWAQTQSHAPLSGESVPADVWTVRSWALGHHAAIVTFPHHDADGACTFVIVMSGHKNWVVVGFKKGVRGDLPALVQQLTYAKGSLLDHLDVLDAETVHLGPGDMIIMPPGLVHSVFTQEAGFCRGGHFYNLDTMHLAEVSRFIDHTRGDNVTNDSHQGVLETLCRMVIGLTILPESRKLYKRSLVALCGMVVYHADYNAKGGIIQVAQNLSMALKIARAVLARLGLGTKQKYLQCLSSGDIFDKGEQLCTIHQFLRSLDPYRL